MGIAGLGLFLLVIVMLGMSCTWLLLQSWKRHDQRHRPAPRKQKRRDLWQASGDRLVSKINNEQGRTAGSDNSWDHDDSEGGGDTDEPGGGQRVR